MRLKTVRSAGLKSLLVIAFFLSFQPDIQAQRANTFGHGLHTYDQYKARLESNAYWNDPSRNARPNSTSTTSGYKEPQRVAAPDYKAREEERRVKEADRIRWEKTIILKGKGGLLLDAKPIKLKGMKNAEYVRKDGLWGIYNESTRTLTIDFAYSDMAELDHKHLKLMKGNQVGIADETGAIKIAMGKYKDVESSGNFFIIKDHQGNFGITSFEDKLLLPPTYQTYFIEHDFILFKSKGDHYTLVNKQGKVVSEGEEIWVTSRNFAFKKFQSKYTFFNPNSGQQLKNKDYSNVGFFAAQNILLATGHEGKTTILNTDGKELSPETFDKVLLTKEDSTVWVTVKGNKIGIIDILINGKSLESLPPIYDSIISYDREIAQAEVLLNGEKKKVPIQMYSGYTSISSFKAGYAKASNTANEFIINKEGRIIGDTYDKIEEIGQHTGKVMYAIVQKGGKKGYLFLNYPHTRLNLIQYEEVSKIDPNTSLSKVKMNGKWGVFYHDINYYGQNKAGETNKSREILVCNYDDVDISGNKTIFIKQKKKWGGLFYPSPNAAPQIIIPTKYDEITAMWYRPRQNTSIKDKSCQVVYYAKKGKSTEYYMDKMGKVNNDMYASGSTYDKMIASTDTPCGGGW